MNLEKISLQRIFNVVENDFSKRRYIQFFFSKQKNVKLFLIFLKNIDDQSQKNIDISTNFEIIFS